jgi:hypothetical protein
MKYSSEAMVNSNVGVLSALGIMCGDNKVGETIISAAGGSIDYNLSGKTGDYKLTVLSVVIDEYQVPYGRSRGAPESVSEQAPVKQPRPTDHVVKVLLDDGTTTEFFGSLGHSTLQYPNGAMCIFSNLHWENFVECTGTKEGILRSVEATFGRAYSDEMSRQIDETPAFDLPEVLRALSSRVMTSASPSASLEPLASQP